MADSGYFNNVLFPDDQSQMHVVRADIFVDGLSTSTFKINAGGMTASTKRKLERVLSFVIDRGAELDRRSKRAAASKTVILTQQDPKDVDQDSSFLAFGFALHLALHRSMDSLASHAADDNSDTLFVLTGALDKEGHVLPVGGLEEKVAAVAAHSVEPGYQKKVFVFPAACMSEASPEFIAAVEALKADGWVVDSISQIDDLAKYYASHTEQSHTLDSFQPKPKNWMFASAVILAAAVCAAVIVQQGMFGPTPETPITSVEEPPSSLEPDAVFAEPLQSGATTLEREDHSPSPSSEPIAIALAPIPEVGEIFRDCDNCPDLVMLEQGAFTMGSLQVERGDDHRIEAYAEIVFQCPFALSQYEITNGDWQACAADETCLPLGETTMESGNALRPVAEVSWNDAQRYVGWLNQQLPQNHPGQYALPTEAQWEFGARACSLDSNETCNSLPFSTGERIEATQAQFDSSQVYNGSIVARPTRTTTLVGSFEANAFGLYDMHGNVSEWTQDCFIQDNSTRPSDGSAVEQTLCQSRAVRGGSFDTPPWELRSASRGRHSPSWSHGEVGFRVAVNYCNQ